MVITGLCDGWSTRNKQDHTLHILYASNGAQISYKFRIQFFVLNLNILLLAEY